MAIDSTSADAPVGTRRRKIALMVFLLTLVLLALLAVSLSPVCVWDGRFELAVAVVSLSREPVSEVSYVTFFRREEAEWTETDTGEACRRSFHPADKDGGRFLATVRCSGKSSIFGVETSYTEPRYIVVRVKYRNGKESRHIAELPAGRGARQMTVLVP